MKNLRSWHLSWAVNRRHTAGTVIAATLQEAVARVLKRHPEAVFHSAIVGFGSELILPPEDEPDLYSANDVLPAPAVPQ